LSDYYKNLAHHRQEKRWEFCPKSLFYSNEFPYYALELSEFDRPISINGNFIVGAHSRNNSYRLDFEAPGQKKYYGNF
jgi:hypothetical protein